MSSISIENIKDILTIIAIITAGFWAYYRFGITRERHPKLQFDLELEVLGKTDQHYIVQLIAIVENKGLTRQYIHDFKFSLLYLNKNSEIDLTDENINHQIRFTSILRSKSWLTQKTSTPFVDGNIKQQFTYNTVIPADADFVLIYSKFRDPKKRSFKKPGDMYHITKTFDLKKLNKE